VSLDWEIRTGKFAHWCLLPGVVRHIENYLCELSRHLEFSPVRDIFHIRTQLEHQIRIALEFINCNVSTLAKWYICLCGGVGKRAGASAQHSGHANSKARIN